MGKDPMSSSPNVYPLLASTPYVRNGYYVPSKEDFDKGGQKTWDLLSSDSLGLDLEDSTSHEWRTGKFLTVVGDSVSGLYHHLLHSASGKNFIVFDLNGESFKFFMDGLLWGFQEGEDREDEHENLVPTTDMYMTSVAHKVDGSDGRFIRDPSLPISFHDFMELRDSLTESFAKSHRLNLPEEDFRLVLPFSPNPLGFSTSLIFPDGTNVSIRGNLQHRTLLDANRSIFGLPLSGPYDAERTFREFSLIRYREWENNFVFQLPNASKTSFDLAESFSNMNLLFSKGGEVAVLFYYMGGFHRWNPPRSNWFESFSNGDHLSESKAPKVPSGRYEFGTTCIDATTPDMEKMVDEAKEIPAATFRRLVGTPAYLNLESSFGYRKENGKLYAPSLSLSSDYATSFHSSTYKGKPCVYVTYSQIFYIFTLSDTSESLLEAFASTGKSFARIDILPYNSAFVPLGSPNPQGFTSSLLFPDGTNVALRNGVFHHEILDINPDVFGREREEIVCEKFRIVRYRTWADKHVFMLPNASKTSFDLAERFARANRIPFESVSLQFNFQGSFIKWPPRGPGWYDDFSDSNLSTLTQTPTLLSALRGTSFVDESDNSYTSSSLDLQDICTEVARKLSASGLESKFGVYSLGEFEEEGSFIWVTPRAGEKEIISAIRKMEVILLDSDEPERDEVHFFYRGGIFEVIFGGPQNDLDMEFTSISLFHRIPSLSRMLQTKLSNHEVLEVRDQLRENFVIRESSSSFTYFDLFALAIPGFSNSSFDPPSSYNPLRNFVREFDLSEIGSDEYGEGNPILFVEEDFKDLLRSVEDSGLLVQRFGSMGAAVLFEGKTIEFGTAEDEHDDESYPGQSFVSYPDRGDFSTVEGRKHYLNSPLSAHEFLELSREVRRFYKIEEVVSESSGVTVFAEPYGLSGLTLVDDALSALRNLENYLFGLGIECDVTMESRVDVDMLFGFDVPFEDLSRRAPRLPSFFETLATAAGGAVAPFVLDSDPEGTYFALRYHKISAIGESAGFTYGDLFRMFCSKISSDEIYRASSGVQAGKVVSPFIEKETGLSDTGVGEYGPVFSTSVENLRSSLDGRGYLCTPYSREDMEFYFLFKDLIFVVLDYEVHGRGEEPFCVIYHIETLDMKGMPFSSPISAHDFLEMGKDLTSKYGKYSELDESVSSYTEWDVLKRILPAVDSASSLAPDSELTPSFIKLLESLGLSYTGKAPGPKSVVNSSRLAGMDIFNGKSLLHVEETLKDRGYFTFSPGFFVLYVVFEGHVYDLYQNSSYWELEVFRVSRFPNSVKQKLLAVGLSSHDYLERIKDLEGVYPPSPALKESSGGKTEWDFLCLFANLMDPNDFSQSTFSHTSPGIRKLMKSVGMKSHRPKVNPFSLKMADLWSGLEQKDLVEALRSKGYLVYGDGLYVRLLVFEGEVWDIYDNSEGIMEIRKAGSFEIGRLKNKLVKMPLSAHEFMERSLETRKVYKDIVLESSSEQKTDIDVFKLLIPGFDPDSDKFPDRRPSLELRRALISAGFKFSGANKSFRPSDSFSSSLPLNPEKSLSDLGYFTLKFSPHNPTFFVVVDKAIYFIEYKTYSHVGITDMDVSPVYSISGTLLRKLSSVSYSAHEFMERVLDLRKAYPYIQPLPESLSLSESSNLDDMESKCLKAVKDFCDYNFSDPLEYSTRWVNTTLEIGVEFKKRWGFAYFAHIMELSSGLRTKLFDISGGSVWVERSGNFVYLTVRFPPPEDVTAHERMEAFDDFRELIRSVSSEIPVKKRMADRMGVYVLTLTFESDEVMVDYLKSSDLFRKMRDISACGIGLRSSHSGKLVFDIPIDKFPGSRSRITSLVRESAESPHVLH